MLAMSKENHLSKTSAKHKKEQSRTRAARVPVSDDVLEIVFDDTVLCRWCCVDGDGLMKLCWDFVCMMQCI